MIAFILFYMLLSFLKVAGVITLGWGWIICLPIILIFIVAVVVAFLSETLWWQRISLSLKLDRMRGL